MPDYWYTPAACKGDDYQYSICTYKKPYFMIYVYDDYRRTYNDYIKNREIIAHRDFNKSLEEILTEGKEEKFIEFYNKCMPFGMGGCTMNRICWHIEDLFRHTKIELRANGHFDYIYLKYDVPVSGDTVSAIKQAELKYNDELAHFKRMPNTREDKHNKRYTIRKRYRRLIQQLCPNEKERLNILLDLNYSQSKSHQFMWDCGGDLIIKRIQELSA